MITLRILYDFHNYGHNTVLKMNLKLPFAIYIFYNLCTINTCVRGCVSIRSLFFKNENEKKKKKKRIPITFTHLLVLDISFCKLSFKPGELTSRVVDIPSQSILVIVIGVQSDYSKTVWGPGSIVTTWKNEITHSSYFFIKCYYTKINNNNNSNNNNNNNKKKKKKKKKKKILTTMTIINLYDRDIGKVCPSIYYCNNIS